MANVGDHGVIEVGGTVSTGLPNEHAVEMQNDHQVLENAGTIATSGNSAFGIYSTGANAAIHNSGAIATSGNDADGIVSDGANAAITSSGTIATSGDSALGIVSYGDNAAITSSGTIATSGDNAQGIFSTGANAAIHNSGAIATSGTVAFGISANGDNAAITSSGAIATSGSNAYGIVSDGTNAAITSSGTIATSGGTAVGIYTSGANAAVTSSGTIATSGGTAYGIYSFGPNATVTNSGAIASHQADAIRFTQGGATLNLLAGSTIQGGLHFSGSGNRLNFAPGQNAVMQLTGPGTLIVSAGGNPFVVVNNTVAVLDRGGFVLTDAMALGLADDLAAGAASGQQQCLSLAAGNDCATTAWLGGFSGFGEQPGGPALASLQQQRGGGLMGVEFGARGGIFLGAVGAHGSTGSKHEASVTGTVAGGHAGITQNGYFADFYASVGVLQVASNRTVADSSVSGGIDITTASQTVQFISPAITVGGEVATGAGVLTPSLRLRYTGLQLGGYSETGASNLVVDSRLVHELDLRAELALALPPLETERGTLSASLRAGADIVHQHSETVTARLLGQPISFTAGGDGTRLRGFAATELGYTLANGARLFGSLETSRDTAGGYSGTARAGLSGSF